MSSYETSATVEEQGRVVLAGVPFAPGTQVEISISPSVPTPAEASPPSDEALAASRERMRELFRVVKGFRMTPRIPREQLYDRGNLR